MTKKLAIVRRNDVVFTEIIDNEPDLFNNQDDSLNSFIEDYKVLELIKNDQQTDKKNKYEEHHILAWKYSNKKLEELHDELKSIEKSKSRTGELTYASRQLNIIKQKLAYLIKKKEDQFILDKISKTNKDDAKLFRSQKECSTFINYVLDKDMEFGQSGENSELNSNLNDHLKLNLKSEQILIEIFKHLNIGYDCRPNVIYNLDIFKLKLEPTILNSLIELKKQMRAIDSSMTRNLVQYDSQLEKFFKVQEKKMIIKLRSLCNQGKLVEKFKNEIKQMHLNNLGLANRISILERNVKRVECKF